MLQLYSKIKAICLVKLQTRLKVEKVTMKMKTLILEKVMDHPQLTNLRIRLEKLHLKSRLTSNLLKRVPTLKFIM